MVKINRKYVVAIDDVKINYPKEENGDYWVTGIQTIHTIIDKKYVIRSTIPIEGKEINNSEKIRLSNNLFNKLNKTLCTDDEL